MHEILVFLNSNQRPKVSSFIGFSYPIFHGPRRQESYIVTSAFKETKIICRALYCNRQHRTVPISVPVILTSLLSGKRWKHSFIIIRLVTIFNGIKIILTASGIKFRVWICGEDVFSLLMWLCYQEILFKWYSTLALCLNVNTGDQNYWGHVINICKSPNQRNSVYFFFLIKKIGEFDVHKLRGFSFNINDIAFLTFALSLWKNIVNLVYSPHTYNV